MTKKRWQFWIETPVASIGGEMEFKRENTSIFNGTEGEAQRLLDDLVSRTWSPFVRYGFYEIAPTVEQDDEAHNDEI